MWNRYFKTRKPWDFKPHELDLGHRITFSNNHLDEFFLHKIAEINGDKFDQLYRRHYTHYTTAPDGNEKDFFSTICNIVLIGYEREKAKEGFRLSVKKKVERDRRMFSFKAFLEYLKNHDKWGIIKSDNERIIELESELFALKEELKKYRASDLMYIRDGHLYTLIHLFQQLRTLEIEEGKPLIKTDKQSGFYKIIANYFNNGGHSISMQSVRKYFPSTDGTSSGREVPEENKIFKISRLK